jgi:hypothetical protein
MNATPHKYPVGNLPRYFPYSRQPAVLQHVINTSESRLWELRINTLHELISFPSRVIYDILIGQMLLGICKNTRPHETC